MILAGLGEQLKVLDVYPAEINFSFEKVNSKVVPVKTNVSLSFMQQYELDGDITVFPDSIKVYGAKKSIDTIHAVYSKPLEKKKLRNPFSDKVELIPIRNVVFSNESVEISGEVEKFTEQTISIPIKLLNVPNGQVVDLMTEKVSLTFLIGMSKVQSYYPSDFEAIVDFEKLAANGSVPIEIVRLAHYRGRRARRVRGEGRPRHDRDEQQRALPVRQGTAGRHDTRHKAHTRGHCREAAQCEDDTDFDIPR